jgi:hypothetical protein
MDQRIISPIRRGNYDPGRPEIYTKSH